MDKIYDKAWKLIAAPERWTQSCLAKNKDGRECHPEDAAAIAWCGRGAILKVYGKDLPELGLDKPLENWNDTHTHTEVVERLKSEDV